MKTGLFGIAVAFAAGLWAGGAVAAPPGNLPFGVYDPDGQFSNDRDVDIEHVFLPWEDVDLTSLIDADKYAAARDRALLITVEPWTWTRDDRNTKDFLLNGIRQGYYDSNMRNVCRVIGALNSPTSVRWAHEMEHDEGQFIWAGWRPEDYIDAFRRMMAICKDAAPNINVVWSPLGHEGSQAYYPGDDIVDLVGISVFGLEPWERKYLGRALTYNELLEERYNRLKGFGKPIFVAEVGFSGSAEYIDTWDGQVAQERPDLPQLVGASYFNQKEVYPWPNGFGLPDWRVSNRIIE